MAMRPSLLGWAGWVLTVVLYGYTILRDPSGELTWMALPIVFFFGLGVWTGKWALSQPCVLVEILYRRVLVKERFVWLTREDRFSASELSMPEVIEEQDSDGDLYYKCVLKLHRNRERLAP
jgi:hypothetical protein